MRATVHPTLVWLGVLGAPLAWVAQLVVGYGLLEAACPQSVGEAAVLDVDPETAIGILTVAAAALATISIVAAALTRSSARANGGSDPTGRIAFMGAAGLLAGFIFLALILLGGAALPSLDACHPG